MLWPILEEAFRLQPAQEWVERLIARRVPAALIQTVNEALDDARQGRRDMIMELSHPDGRRIEMVGNPIKFVGDAPVAPAFPPKLGEDSESVLTELLSLPREEIESLCNAGVIRRSPDRA